MSGSPAHEHGPFLRVIVPVFQKSAMFSPSNLDDFLFDLF